MGRIVPHLVQEHSTNCPFEITTRLDIRVRFLDLPDGCRGFYVNVDNIPFMAISNNITYEDQRFVCAHELGHHQLHDGIGYYFIVEKTLFSPSKFEAQANRFAVELLSYGTSPKVGESIKNYFKRIGIPKEMMIYSKYLNRSGI